MTKPLLWAVLFLVPVLSSAKTVHYELNVENKPVNVSGHGPVPFALTVNGGIPAPTLTFTEGDDAEIVVRNSLSSEEVSIHWHGLLLPPEEDGVAYLNTPPIHPGQTRTFRFRLRQSGTYWYHSHTGLQEQKGVFGAFVIQPKISKIAADKEAVALLSDWSDENPDQILRNLKKDGDYYLFKKQNVRSYWGAWRAGELATYLRNEWQRMGGMDLSDIGYDAFLINGKKSSQLLSAHPGERVRLRLINAASSSYFHVSLAGLPMTIVAADGIDIEPVQTTEILMGMAETYDVLFTLPAHKNYELRATAQDVTGSASAFIGMGAPQLAPSKPAPDPYAPMDHSAHGSSHAAHNMTEMNASHGHPADHTDHHHMHHEQHDEHHLESVRKVAVVNVDELKAQAPTTLPAQAKVTDVKLVLGGDMRRYVWHINGKAIFEDRDIKIQQGDVIRFTFVNETMMHHPMHLHGHFFRVLNQFGERSPLKHTVDVPPHATRTIEFYANEPGQWMLHCHNLYHMHTGMARVVSYMSYQPSQHSSHDPHLHDPLYWTGSLQAATNRAEVALKASQTWNSFELRAESTNTSPRAFDLSERWEFEGDALYTRWVGTLLSFHAGFTSYDDKGSGLAGMGYLLPLLIESRFFINTKGKLRLDLTRHFQWTSVLCSDVELRFRPDWGTEHNTDVSATLMYGPQWNWSAGLVFTNESVGAGLNVKF